ncbi:MAG: DUF1501 domain-containing protein, partial [Gemmataceae bacterium]|nr:DUF1501 domain-containing protein [Gemmataceae bacterium]
MRPHRHTRRSFLADTGLGFTGLALGAMLFKDGVARAASAQTGPTSGPHHPAKAKSVIWIFLCGGVSHLESWDPKPELNTHAGKSIADTPYAGVLKAEKKDVLEGNPSHGNRKTLMALNCGYRRYGKSGLLAADWWKHTAEMADELAVVRSVWTTDNDHGAMLQFHTGRHVREGAHPTAGAWACYGLGALTDDLPEYVVLGAPPGDCCGGAWAHGAAYLGPEHAGVRLALDGPSPLPFGRPAAGKTAQDQADEFGLIGRLNRLSGIDYPDDPQLQARIKSYELAFKMQTAVPDTLRLDRESDKTRALYGIDRPESAAFGRTCLAARRLVERGVRFVQVFHGGGGGGEWDAHSKIKDNHTKLAAQTDKPISGLLRDLRQRGLLSDTLVVWATEFGRSPGA